MPTLAEEMTDRLKSAERARVQRLLVDDCARLRARLNLPALRFGESCEDAYRACKRTCPLKNSREYPIAGPSPEPR